MDRYSMKSSNPLHWSSLSSLDVKDYLNGLRMELLRHQTAETNIKARDGEDRERAVTARYEALRAINDFYKRFPPLLSPYARMDQKLPLWRLRRWLQR
jgi:hypothetical protein